VRARVEKGFGGRRREMRARKWVAIRWVRDENGSSQKEKSNLPSPRKLELIGFSSSLPLLEMRRDDGLDNEPGSRDGREEGHEVEIQGRRQREVEIQGRRQRRRRRVESLSFG
jgi:hypothetical protein